ncbi:MAG: aminoglycoside phosphotransferase family protein [Gammaproteobacteria bacterium]|nr:aminoglycoside phosphotransferase family protein [Gammaproteobacteria bacterium]MDH3370669.1 aminoglycoside phosphotransferase family protein [Gammaproteobacteria bacterium]MDH3406068.1 aminoglycoside phosphotransferase family protein [Gammaproteobacteria bacterium]
MPLEHDIARLFVPDGEAVTIVPLRHGLINDSFLVTTKSGPWAVLQRINRHVFPKPELIMENLRVLAAHVRGRAVSGNAAGDEIRLPEILKTQDGRDYVIDAEGGCWRALEYIEDSQTIESIKEIRQAEEVGVALGRFHTLIHNLDPARLHQTLPGFHDAPGYFTRFLRASARPRHVLVERNLLQGLSFVENRWGLTRVLDQARRDGKLMIRPIHGDTKLNNFLFNKNTGKAVSLIDLDTVQPGLIHFDIGDCLRSCANPAGESPEDIASVCFDLDIGRAILEHYFAETREFLTRADFEYFYDAIRLIPFELGLRFLTDHLEGDHYFKIDHPGQNLHRAQVQFRLTASIEEQEQLIKKLITRFAVMHSR